MSFWRNKLKIFQRIHIYFGKRLKSTKKYKVRTKSKSKLMSNSSTNSITSITIDNVISLTALLITLAIVKVCLKDGYLNFTFLERVKIKIK